MRPRRRKPALPRCATASPTLAPPPQLEAHQFTAGADEFAVFEWPVAAIELPRALTRAESEVVALVAAGLSNEEIARRRGTSARTVANQLASSFRKLEVGSRHELVSAVHRRR